MRQQLLLALAVVVVLAPTAEEERRGVDVRKMTFNLAEGFDRVRWNDDAETVRSFCPGTRTRTRRVGVDPRTGESIVRHAGLAMSQPAFAVPVPSEPLILASAWGSTSRESPTSTPRHMVHVRVRLLLEWDGSHFRFERPRP